MAMMAIQAKRRAVITSVVCSHRRRLVLDFVGSHVLGNTSGFTGHHVGFADEIEESRLTVIDVAHDHHNGWTLLSV